MAVKGLLVFSFLICSLGCAAGGTDPLASSYRKLREVPRGTWDKLAQKRIFFGHQSVGRNILEGLGRVLETAPEVRLDIREAAVPEDLAKPGLVHSRIGQNRDPLGKIDHFGRLLRDGIGRSADIALFKLCYVDIDRSTDIAALTAHYDRALAGLREEFPNLIILPVTAPLTNATPGIKARIKRVLGMGPATKPDNIRRNVFNAHIRTAYGPAIWDLAGAEASTADGPATSFRDGEASYLLLNKAYSLDGGHLNEVGSQVVAIDLLLRLASLISD